MAAGRVKVAVIGMGEAGRGWAALCVAAGWPVALYDNEAHSLHEAPGDVTARARSLIELQRASEADVESGIQSLSVGRSLLQACGDAIWVIEAVRQGGSDWDRSHRMRRVLRGCGPSPGFIEDWQLAGALCSEDVAALVELVTKRRTVNLAHLCRFCRQYQGPEESSRFGDERAA